MVHRRGIGAGAEAGDPARRAALALVFCLLSLAGFAQEGGLAPAEDEGGAPKARGGIPTLIVLGSVEALFPIGESASLYRNGFGASAILEYPLLPYLFPFARAGFSNAPLQSSESLSFSEGGLGLALSYRPLDELDLRFEGFGGFASVSSADFEGGGLYSFGARLGAGYRLHPAFTLYASGGATAYIGSSESLWVGAAAGLTASLKLDSFRADSSKVRIRSVKAEPVFPVFYGYYDEHPFGSVRFTNEEDAELEDVEVSFVVGRYMDRPKVCARIPSVAKGASAEAPLTALFNDSVLSLTEGATVRGEVVVSFQHLGSRRRVSAPVEMRMHHRNAMNWLDDRRAAAFASPKDPASLWFSRFVSGVVRDRLRGDIDRNLQYAVGMFEAERIFGLNYVVDPASSYVEKAANEATVDYLQFPHQTLAYRGGDCDDLTILYASLLQSVGIETALVTIPGHIYLAFALEADARKAREEFYDQGLLIYSEGKAWVPVEITMVKEGFVKAWRIGAKEWQDNAKLGTGALYPLAEAWKTYPAVGVPDVNPRFALPTESQLAQAFDLSLDRYVARDIEEQVAQVKATSAIKGQAAASNDLGILYGRYGMLKESWKELGAAAKAGFAPAWINLANVAFLRKDYKLSLEYYRHARAVNDDDPAAILGEARSYYELEHFDEADAAYEELKLASPELADRYAYLASIMGGEGRAWSFSERLASVSWATGIRAPNAAPVAAAALVTAPPAEPEAAPPEPPSEELPAEPEAAPVELALAAPEPEPLIIAPNAPDPVAAAPEPIVPPPPPAPPKPAPARASAPPAIAEEMPEDREIAEMKEAEGWAEPPKAALVAPPPALDAGAPAIAAELPEDREIAEMRAAESAAREPQKPLAVAPPNPAPEPIAAPEPEPVAAAEPAPVAEPKPLEPAPEPVAVLEPEPVALLDPEPVEPAPEPVLAAAPEPEVAAAEPAPVGESDIPASPEFIILAEGFARLKPYTGAWKIGTGKAEQLDPAHYYAKLAMELGQGQKPMRFSFAARSTGYKWVGLGIHIYARGVATHKLYGEGRSLLVWLTSDPVHNPSAATRLQVYRSLGDSVIADAPAERLLDLEIPESIFASHEYRVEVDPASGGLAVLVDGVERGRLAGLPDLASASVVALRALDKAEFTDFRVEEAR